MGLPEVLRLVYKCYGGVEFFYDKPYTLFIDCVEHALEKEQEIPRLIDIIFSKLLGTEPHMPAPQPKKHMRSAEEIMSDYGLEV